MFCCKAITDRYYFTKNEHCSQRDRPKHIAGIVHKAMSRANLILKTCLLYTSDAADE